MNEKRKSSIMIVKKERPKKIISVFISFCSWL